MSILGWTAACIGVMMGLSGIPQILRIVKNKSANDVSSKTYIILLFGSIIWLLYSIEIESIPLFASNFIGILINLIILALCKRY